MGFHCELRGGGLLHVSLWKQKVSPSSPFLSLFCVLSTQWVPCIMLTAVDRVDEALLGRGLSLMVDADKAAGTSALRGVTKTRSLSPAILTCPPGILPPIPAFTYCLCQGTHQPLLSLGALGPAASVTAPVKQLSWCSVFTDANLGIILTLLPPTPPWPSHH